MINLDDWSDYSKSASYVRCVEHHTKSGRVPRLLVFGVHNVIKANGFVPEDVGYAMGLIGEKTPNSSSN